MLESLAQALKAQGHHLSARPFLAFQQLCNEVLGDPWTTSSVKAWFRRAGERWPRPWLQKLWPDPASGSRCVATFEGDDILHDCQFSPDSSRLAVCSLGTEGVRVWEPATQREISQFLGHQGGVRACSWSPDGHALVSVGDDGTVRVWDALTGEQHWAVSDNSALSPQRRRWEPRLCCAWSPDGRYVLVGGLQSLDILDARTGAVRARQLLQGTRSCAFSPSGNRVAALVGGDLLVWQFAIDTWPHATPEFQWHSSSQGPKGRCLFSSDGRVLAWTQAGQLHFVETESWDEGQLPVGTGTVDCALSPRGEYAISVGGIDQYSESYVHNLKARSLIGEVSHSDVILGCAWSSDGRLIATCSKDESAKVWDASCLGTAEHQGHAFEVRAVAWTPDGKKILSLGRDVLCQWDAQSGKLESSFVRREVTGRAALAWCDCAPDGRQVVFVDESGALTVLGIRDGEIRWEQRGGSSRLSCAWAATGGVIAACGDNGVRLYHAMSGEMLGIVPGTESATRLSPMPNTSWLVADCWSGACILDTATGQVVQALQSAVPDDIPLHGRTWHDVACAPDASSVAASRVDDQVGVWSLHPTGAVYSLLEGHAASKIATAYYGRYGAPAAVCCAFVTDRRALATAFIDGFVKIWDVATGQVRAILATNSRFVALAVWGDRLCLGDDQGRVYLFRARGYR